MGPEVALVNAGAEVRHTLHALARRRLLAPEGGRAYCVRDRPENFGRWRRFLREGLRLPCGW